MFQQCCAVTNRGVRCKRFGKRAACYHHRYKRSRHIFKHQPVRRPTFRVPRRKTWFNFNWLMFG